MNEREQFYFVAKCLSLTHYPERRDEVISALITEKISHSDFIRLCDKHLIIPAIYCVLKKEKLLYLFSEEIVDHLKHIYSLNKNRNERILQQIKEINSKLVDKGIQAVFLKGTANLLEGVYSDIGERMIGDIDFLVDEKDYKETIKALFELNYIKHKEDPGEALPNNKHYVPLYRDDYVAMVEIHRLAVDFEHSGAFSPEGILKRKKSSNSCKSVKVPSDEDKVVHNFIHNQLSDNGYRLKRNNLRDLYDLFLLTFNIDRLPGVYPAGYNKKMISYYTYASKVFDLNRVLPVNTKIDSRLHVFLCDYLLNFPKISDFIAELYYHFRLYCLYYPGRTFRLIFNRKYRAYYLKQGR